MSTALFSLSQEQFLCSICLGVFTDPVTAACGHNFCKRCIERLKSDWSRPYTCPYCKQTLNRRCNFHVNTLLSEMVRLVKAKAPSGEQAAKPGDVACDVCSEPPLKALKSCLVCLMSFCELHLRPHLSAPGLCGHELSTPLTDLPWRLCEEHHKALELFCQDDQLCVCTLCSVGEHKGHELLTLSQASQQKRQQLSGDTKDIPERIQTVEAR